MAKPKVKLSISDERMLQLIYYIESVSLKGIKSIKEICAIFGILNTSIYEVKAGRRGFTPLQIMNACKYFEIDANWVFGLSETMFRKNISEPLELLRQAVVAVESKYGPKIEVRNDAKAKKPAPVKKVAKVK